jgi:hypothetical protein
VHHNGTYISQVFPADLDSAPAPGTLQLGQPGLLEGDRVPPSGFDRTTCIAVNGGYVSVPYDPTLNPSKADGFSLEAWVHSGWSADPTVDPPGQRTIMTALDFGGGHGYWLFASKDNMWEVFLGNGPGPTIVTGTPVQLNTTSHVVLTYDGSLLRLFIDGSQVAATPTDYVPTDQSSLFIGAGAPYMPQPRFPWVGNIQCVALYKGALDADQVAKHTVWGNGGFTS